MCINNFCKTPHHGWYRGYLGLCMRNMFGIFKMSLFGIFKLLTINIIIILSGCASLPSDEYLKSFAKTESGCYIGKKPDAFSKIAWTGECVNGLASGKGTYIAYKKDKPTEIAERYDGLMSRGMFDGKGAYTIGNRVKYGTFVDAYHSSSNSGKFYGRLFIDRKLSREGEFDSNTRLENGLVFFNTGHYVEGIFDVNAKSVNYGTGEGIKSGKRYPPAEFKSDCADASDPKLTAFQKQELDDKCLYDKTLIQKPAIGGYFEGKVYSSMGELNNAKADFAIAKVERERIEEAQAVERARVQAIEDAERARIQAIADAERYRLQQIENVKQARYSQLRQPCTDARSEAASLQDPELESLKITVTTLSVGAIAMAFEKNKDRVARYKRELEKAADDLKRQERIFEQAKSRANANADTACQRAELAVANQKSQDDGHPVRAQPIASYTPTPAQQTQFTTNSSSDNNEALSASCTAETNRLLKEGTQAVARGRAQQDANMIRRGYLELARNLQTIISTNEGRCREGKSSVSDRFNALKMLQDVSLACNRGGYGADCDREKQEAVQSVVRSQPAPTRSQPTQSMASNSQGSRSNSGQNSGNSDNGIETAGQCISISRPANSWAVMRNTCPYDIEASWCYVNGDCKYGNWGATNLGTIRAGGSRDASTFTSKSSRLDIYYIACKGRNTNPKETDAKYFTCTK